MSNVLVNELHEVFPPVEIALPTRGLFYPVGVLSEDADPEHISVGTLGIMDEFKFRDPFFLVTGKAINHLVHHICGDQIVVPEELCEIDVEAILLASRIASYGPNLKITHTCQQMWTRPSQIDEPGLPELCGNVRPMVLDLHEFILRYGPIENEGIFEVLLPRVKQTVYLKPQPYRTTINILRTVMGNSKRLENLQEYRDDFVADPVLLKEYESLLSTSADVQISTILDCIWAVKTRSGHMVEDPDDIRAWIFELPKSDHDVIAARIKEIADEFRKISMLSYQCEQCGATNEFNLQMNAEILFLAVSEESPAPQTSSDTRGKNRNSYRKPSRISRK